MRAPTVDWMIATAVAGTLLIGAEAVKLVLRMERRAASAPAGKSLAGRSPSRA
jgi:UPF0716 family protein affecting phage T7 exclusion